VRGAHGLADLAGLQALLNPAERVLQRTHSARWIVSTSKASMTSPFCMS
jgi:hypothetical protein